MICSPLNGAHNAPKHLSCYLPFGVYEFWAAFTASSLPECADEVWQIVNTAIRKTSAKEQRAKFNIGFGGLKRQKSQPLKAFRVWLETPEVLKISMESGIFQHHLKWWIAIGKIIAGKSVNVEGGKQENVSALAAFGGGKPGRPASTKFSSADLVAAFILLHEPASRNSIEKMIASWVEGPGMKVASNIDEREVRRVLNDDTHFIHKLSGDDLRALALGQIAVSSLPLEDGWQPPS